ncbi:hypothetical protein EYF80_017432 [Liparis tanakae]|uniref:Uncharacterized protein n=1 Tax=Liparis tanakae TaxID=230148 RepID=A0A4Z2I591_9TELE|nr:hypothetical protein EYF80_017432 [Liparis tanakae]
MNILHAHCGLPVSQVASSSNSASSGRHKENSHAPKPSPLFPLVRPPLLRVPVSSAERSAFRAPAPAARARVVVTGRGSSRSPLSGSISSPSGLRTWQVSSQFFSSALCIVVVARLPSTTPGEAPAVLHSAFL